MIDSDRPIVKLDYIFNGCTALIDTGALFPVWTKDTKLLEQLGAKLVKKDVGFNGFGGKAIGDLYEITIKIGALIFPYMNIIACKNEDIPGFFIFSATMFKNAIYTIDDINKKFIIRTVDNQICRNLKIRDKNGQIHVLCNCEE
jgi:hypothetical protein